MSEAISRTDLDLPLLRRGKVRDVYDLGEALLFVATDRVSAFDVVLPQPIPRKGEVLTLVSAWWFAQLGDLVPHHLLSVDPEEMVERFPALRTARARWERRSMLVRKLEPIPVECVVRGYLSGSAWKEYRAGGTLAGEALSPGLGESHRIEPAIFSPATKAEEGHDENIPFREMERLLGVGIAGKLREISLRIYERGREIAAARGIIIADTKFEFGRDAEGRLRLMDEVLTPDSSRFWPADRFESGRPQPSMDKQPVRDYLESLVTAGHWDRQAPGPDLPEALVKETSERYQEVFRRLTGRSLDEVDLSTWGRA